METGDIQARRAYLRSVISQIEIDDDKVKIIGDKATLACLAAGCSRSAPLPGPSGMMTLFLPSYKTEEMRASLGINKLQIGRRLLLDGLQNNVGDPIWVLCGRAVISVCPSAISVNSGVGEKPASVGVEINPSSRL